MKHEGYIQLITGIVSVRQPITDYPYTFHYFLQTIGDLEERERYKDIAIWITDRVGKS